MKRCSKCEEPKPFSEFYTDKQGKNGFRPECKKCTNSCAKKHYQTHKVKYFKRDIEYRKTHKNEIAERGRKYYETTIGHLRCVYNAMKRRCVNPKCSGYKNYGGRGIKCLFKTSDEFVNYVIGKLQTDPHGLQIDRINNNGNYESGNIRFVTRSGNARNKRK